jgi:hypothetical protein
MTQRIENDVERLLRLANKICDGEPGLHNRFTVIELRDVVRDLAAALRQQVMAESELLRVMARESIGPNSKIIAMWERYAEISRKRALSEMTVEQLMKRVEDCYAEITRRSLLAINGPKS